MYYLENNDGFFYSENGLVDDLDQGKEFETFDDAYNARKKLPEQWAIIEDNIFGQPYINERTQEIDDD